MPLEEARAASAAAQATAEAALAEVEAAKAAAAGWLEPANDLIERDRAQIDVDGFIPSVWDTHTKVGLFPGQIGGLPLNVTTRILVYDKKLFNESQEQADFKAKYGYDLAAPKTTQAWRDMAEFFTRDTDGGQHAIVGVSPD